MNNLALNTIALSISVMLIVWVCLLPGTQEKRAVGINPSTQSGVGAAADVKTQPSIPHITTQNHFRDAAGKVKER